MKILLLNPPRENEIIGNNPPIIEKKRGKTPPLGILYVAAYLRKFSDHDIKIIDSQVENLDYGSLEKKIRSFMPDVVGITTMTMTLIDVIESVRVVKKVDRDIKIVLGGPHVHIFPEETINLKGVDYLVLGEGEETFKDLLDNMDSPSKLKKVPGLVYRFNGEILNTGARPLIEKLDSLPFPARSLTPYQKYYSLMSSGNIVTTVFTSRGCPYKCAFCDRPHLGQRFRARSAMNVVDEIEECVGMGINDFLFYDDTFCVKKERVIRICREIVRRGLEVSWDIRTRVDTVDEDVLKNLKRAGCKAIHYGIESGSEKILKVLKKQITIAKARRIFELTGKYGMETLSYFMIGNPTETLEDIRETFRIIKTLNPDYLHLTILTPFPGTELYAEGLKKGIIKKDYWGEFAKNPSASFVAPHFAEYFSREKLNDLLVEGYKSFYLRPSYIIKRSLRTKTFGEFLRKASAGFSVLRMRS